MENKIVLSPKKILNKQFQVDFKGYHAEEVDHFLDQVSADYTNFAAMLNESYEQIERLQRENQSLKKRINELERSQERVAQMIFLAMLIYCVVFPSLKRLFTTKAKIKEDVCEN